MGKNLESASITSAERGMMKVYASHAYTAGSPRTTDYVDVNIPEYAPTIPQDESYSLVNSSSQYFTNTNYGSKSSGSVELAHHISIKLARGTCCPTVFPKGTEFLLFYPSGKIEEGVLIYL